MLGLLVSKPLQGVGEDERSQPVLSPTNSGRKSEIATSAQVRSCRQQLSVRAVEGKVDPYIECGEKYWGTQMTLTLLVLRI